MRYFFLFLFFTGIYQISLGQTVEVNLNSSTIDSSIYNFKFYNTKGEIVTLNKYKGKVLFVDFWFTGCSACLGYFNEILEPVQKYYKGKGDVVFVSVSIDNDNLKWLETINKGYAINKRGDRLRQTEKDGINLRCINWINSPIIKYFNIKSYPRPMLFDRNGHLFNHSKKNLRLDGVDSVVTYIELAKQK